MEEMALYEDHFPSPIPFPVSSLNSFQNVELLLLRKGPKWKCFSPAIAYSVWVRGKG